LNELTESEAPFFMLNVDYLLSEFFAFWLALKKKRAEGDVRDWMVHRVREEWMPWWLELSPDRQARITEALSDLAPTEILPFRGKLVAGIEADCEREGVPLNGRGSGDWVLMQLAHAKPFEESKVFEDWRLDRVSGFRCLCLLPDRSFPIHAILLRRGGESAHYSYNLDLDDAIGVSSAIEAAAHLLSRGRGLFSFNGRPRGWFHQPLALRLPVTAALIVGPGCTVGIYVMSWLGLLTDSRLAELSHAVCLSALLFLALWTLSLVSDWAVERRMAVLLENSQVAWALGDIIPSDRGRNDLHIDGESFGAALAMQILSSLMAEINDTDSWVAWCIRRAAGNKNEFGITGVISPTGKIMTVTCMQKKKAICVEERRSLLAPVQVDADVTEAEPRLHVVKCETLASMIWAAGKISEFKLWIGTAVAVLLLIFGYFTHGSVWPQPSPELDLGRPPIIEDRNHHIQRLTLHLRTDCPECFVVRLHSSFWKATGEQHLAQAKGSDVAVVEIELLPQDGVTGGGMDSSVEIQRTRRLPFLRLPPEPCEEMTFFWLNDMYERSKGVGKYAFPNH